MLFCPWLDGFQQIAVNCLGTLSWDCIWQKDLDHSQNKINVLRYSFYSLNQTNTINNILCSQVSALAQSTALPVAYRRTAENSLFILIQGLLIFKVFLQGRRSQLEKHTHKSEFNNRTRVYLQYQTEKKCLRNCPIWNLTGYTA